MRRISPIQCHSYGSPKTVARMAVVQSSSGQLADRLEDKFACHLTDTGVSCPAVVLGVPGAFGDEKQEKRN